MAGFADLFYLGRPDPARQLAAMLSGQQQPGAPPAGAAPPPVDPNAPAPGAQPVAAAAPAGAPGATQNPAPGDAAQNAPTVPNVLKSTPDMSQSYQQLANPPNLMSLYLQMQQKQSAEDGINRGLALITANHSPPSMREAIMQSMTGGQSDTGQTVNNLMSLYQGQQQMAANQQLLAQAPDIAAKLGLPLAVVEARIRAGGGADLVKSMEPTTEMRDIQSKHDMFIKGGGTEDDWQRNYLPFIISGGAGGGDATTKSWQTDRIMWDRDHPGQPYPWGDNNPSSYGLWKAQQGEMVKDQEDARNKLHNGYEQNITDLRSHLANVIGLKPGGDPNNPDDYDPGKQALLKSALSKPGAQAYLSADPKDLSTQALGAALSPDEKAVLDEIRDTTDPKQLFGTLNTRAPKRGVSDVTAIGSGLTSMQNIRQGPDRYLDAVKSTIGATDKALGNGYGAAGEAENAPDYTKSLIDDAYLPNGSLYPFGKKTQPMSPDQIKQAQTAIAARPADKAKIIRVIRANNFDATPVM
jgi:hypothetical protein